jgi:hypothetical protein
MEQVGFTERSTMSKTVDSEDAMVQYVARTPGALGRVSGNALYQEVKVLAVLSYDLRAERAEAVVNVVRYVKSPSPGPALVISFVEGAVGRKALERAATHSTVNGQPVRVIRSAWEDIP